MVGVRARARARVELVAHVDSWRLTWSKGEGRSKAGARVRGRGVWVAAHVDGGRLARVARVLLEGEAEDGDLLTRDRVEHGAHLVVRVRVGVRV